MTQTRRDELKARCLKLSERYGHGPNDVEKGLEHYSVHLLAQREGYDYAVLEGGSTEDADLSDYVSAGKGDLSIDGLLNDAANNQVSIVQATWVGKQTDKLFEKASHFFHRLPSWLDPAEVAKGNEKVQGLLLDADLQPDVQHVSLYFVTNLALGEDHRLHQIAAEAQEAYEDRGWDVECLALGSAELLRLEEELTNARSGSLVPELSFQVQEGSQFVFAHEPRVLVCAVKGNEIASIYHRTNVKNALFNANIRLALASGKVNPAIQKTAQDPGDGANFFYFNNGITATCTSFEMQDNTVSARNMQVVNGAQTVNALAKALHKTPNPSVYVLLRLIETSESYGRKNNFAENVTRFQNTQNPVRLSDFFSNDKLQLWLRDNLAAELSGRGANASFYYVHKRGYKPSRAAGFAVTLEELALLRHSLLYGPAHSYGESKSFWDATRDGRYWQAFGDDGQAVDMWDAEDLAIVGWGIRTWTDMRKEHKDLRARARKNPGGSVSSETGYLGYLARYATALAYTGMLELRNENHFSSFRAVMATSDMYDRYSRPVVMKAREMLQEAMRERSKGTQANPRLNLSRDQEKFNELREALIDKIASGYVEIR